MTKEKFDELVYSVQSDENYKSPIAFGIGLRRSKGAKILDVYYPNINYHTNRSACALLQSITEYKEQENGFHLISSDHIEEALRYLSEMEDDHVKDPNLSILKHVHKMDQLDLNSYYQTDIIVYFLFDKSQPVKTVEEAYFKIQCLSQLHVKPHQINVNGIFGVLNNVAWTNKGPICPEDLSDERIKWLMCGEELVVSHVDKFPYMVNYHIPEGVRIVSGAKVRLGAHLSPGTTVMPAGFVNFNAGTLGSAMIEGRVSAGVIVGEDSDIGGGASIMGTLSGGNKNVISIGRNCLLGANAGTGISLGDGCTVAAGVYVTAAAKVSLYDADNNPVDIDGNTVSDGNNVVKAEALNGREYLLFYNDSLSGRLIARPNTKIIELNKSLHV